MSQQKTLLMKRAVQCFGGDGALVHGILSELSSAFNEERRPRFSKEEREVLNTCIEQFVRTTLTLTWRDVELLKGGVGGGWASDIKE